MLLVSSPPFFLASRCSYCVTQDFKRGNIINIVFAGIATVLWLVQKAYYKYRNAKNARRWAALTDQEKEAEELQAEGKGNRSVTYHFTN